jgi:hypothetical protein
MPCLDLLSQEIAGRGVVRRGHLHPTEKQQAVRSGGPATAVFASTLSRMVHTTLGLLQGRSTTMSARGEVALHPASVLATLIRRSPVLRWLRACASTSGAFSEASTPKPIFCTRTRNIKHWLSVHTPETPNWHWLSGGRRVCACTHALPYAEYHRAEQDAGELDCLRVS